MEHKNKKILIFGAGVYGARALEEYGAENVECFLDNSESKLGTYVKGKLVKSIQEMLPRIESYRIVVATSYWASIEKQLRELGISGYEIFEEEKLHGYSETDELIVNPYLAMQEALTEDEWSGNERMQYMRKAVYDAVENFQEKQPLFNHIEVETINRCNGVCSFCPINKNDDPREKKVMTRELFEKIVDQLAEINYSGKFALFSNNEPLLDDRIIEFNRYARKRLPNARMHLFTNGTLLTIDKFVALTEVLDELVIDNYHQELKLIKPCIEIEEYCGEHPELKKKVTIVLRKPQEILTSRGGNAPNRKKIIPYGKDRCILPYKQMIVRPDGKVSLCCNDAIGKYTLGDLNEESILDVWYGPQFQMIRKCLYEGRENWGDCQYCDNFSIG